MSNMQSGISSIEMFEAMLKELIHSYVRTISPRAPCDFNTVRLSVTGPGFSMTYDKFATTEDQPTLTLSLTPTPTEGRRR
jgi:hypothetical protein